MKCRFDKHVLCILVSIFPLLTLNGVSFAQNVQKQSTPVMLLEKPPTTSLEAEQDRFKRRYGGEVFWNPKTKLPAKISELQARIAPSLSKETADVHIREFIQANRSLLGIRAGELEMLSLQSIEGKFYVKYRQTYNGIPVAGHEVGCIVDEDGNLTRYTSSFNPDLRISTEARISREDALRKVRSTLGQIGRTAQVKEFSKVILPRSENHQTHYILAYRVIMKTEARNQNPHQLVIIDANTGEVISRWDATPWSINGTIRGEILPEQATDTAQTRPLKSLNVYALRTSQPIPGMVVSNTSGSTGSYSLASWSGSWNLLASLSGPYASVTSVSQTNVSHVAGLVDGSTHNVTWNTAGGDDLDQINVYYHINRIRDELYKDILSYSWENPWTKTSQFTAETGYSFNNAYSGDPMTFGLNPFARNADVIYHESTHNVLFSLFGGWVGYGPTSQDRHSEAYAFDEGFADFFSAVLLNRPNTNGRNLDNALDYPANYTVNTGQGLEGHTGGQLIAGATWDLRGLMQEKLGANQGARANAKLVFKALTTLSSDPRPYRFSLPGTSNLFDALLRADDSNNNLSDGTPWDQAIFQAFRNHGMLPVDVFIADRQGDTGNVPSNPNGEVWWLSPDIYIDAPPFVSSTGNPTHESPQQNVQNHVRVMVRNTGYLTAKKVKVTLYAMNLLGAPGTEKWNEIGSVFVQNIPANGSLLSTPINWTYKWGEILMAKLTTSEDPITEPYSVPLENNLAQRNLTAYVVWAGAKLDIPCVFLPIGINKWILKPGLKPSKKAETSLDVFIERAPDGFTVQLNLPENMREQITKPLVPMRSQIEMSPSLIPAIKQNGKEVREREMILKRAEKAFAELARTVFSPEREPYIPSTEGPVQAEDRAAKKIPVLIESYRDVPLPIDERTHLSLSLQVPRNARPGDVYVFHVASRVNGEIVDGMTYEIRVENKTDDRVRELQQRIWIH